MPNLSGPRLILALLLILFPLRASAAGVPDALNGVHRLVTLGDSITQFGGRPGGYVWQMQQYLQTLYPNASIQVLNAGVSGNTSKDMLARFQRDVINRHADLVTISVGINDVWHGFDKDHPAGGGPAGVPLDDFRRDVEAMVDTAQKAGARVALFTPTIFEDKPDSPRNTALKGYVEAIRKIARDHRLILVHQNDAFMKAWRDEAAGAPRLTVDGVHMAAAGDDLMARTALLALGVSAKDLDAAAPRVQQAIVAASEKQLPPPVFPIQVTESRPWDILSGPANQWSESNPAVITVAPGTEGLALEFNIPPALGEGRGAAYAGVDRSGLLDGGRRMPPPLGARFAAWASREVNPVPMGYDGIRFEIQAAIPSLDWPLNIDLTQDDGALYVLRSAVTPDRPGWVRGYALFRDFTLVTDSAFPEHSDPSFDRIDPARIRSIGFGVELKQPGKNTLRIRNMELIKVNPKLLGAEAPEVLEAPGMAEAAVDAAAAKGVSPAFQVDIDRTLSVNNHDEIPSGLFGIDFGDGEGSDNPAAIAAAHDLRPGFLHITHRVGEGSADDARLSAYERNSPAERLIRGTGATEWLLTITGNGRPPLSNDAWAYSAVADLARYIRGAPKDLPAPAFEIWDHPDIRGTFASGTNAGEIQAILDDPDRGDLVLGPVAREIYAGVYVGAYHQAKENFPELLVGGFGLGLPEGESGDIWRSWWRPLLDGANDRYDLLTERHAQETGDSVQANLMLLAAYTIYRRGRIVPVYSLPDAPVPAQEKPVEALTALPRRQDADWDAADYEIRDILTLLREPDQAVARAAVIPLPGAAPGSPAAPGSTAPPESSALAAPTTGTPATVAFPPDDAVYAAHEVLKDLRGLRLLVTPALSNDVEAVASLDGDNVVIVLYNHAGSYRSVHLIVPAPHAGRYNSAVESQFGYDTALHHFLMQRDKELPVTGQGFDLSATLPGRTLASFKLQSSIHIKPTREWELGDGFANRWFLDLYPGHTESAQISLPGFEGVRAAELRLALEGAAYGAGELLINGHPIPLPFSPGGQPSIHRVLLNPAWLKPGENDLVIINNDLPGAGSFRFLAASIRLLREQRREPRPEVNLF
ncbi:MAG TPA: SGNH/GDSL hydrolase family protein [Armatimonadota bacterium]|nr:SGNH/GDSL hydrolase family protein [Armatimonadota bacterium]